MPIDHPARQGCLHLRRRTRRAHRATACAAAWLAVLCAPVVAAAAKTTTKAAVPVDPTERQQLPPATGSNGTDVASGMGGTMLRLALGLVIVVGLIAGVYFLMKRMQRGRMPGFGGGAADDLVDVVSTTPLGPNRFLHLIRVGEELILVGATEQSVTPVARIGGEDAVGMLGENADVQAATDAFRAAQARTGTDPRVRAAATAEQASLVERLRALTTRK
ncbi:MAG: FliO/MopB family protein [Thermoleophilia bacterium]|nr:FliO/MopB family protein [Thermoleophilia bacterium]